MRIGIIYKVISPSGKVYIGQTIKTLVRRKGNHHSDAFNKNRIGYNYKIARAIRKYGDALEWTILYNNVPVNNLNVLEIKEVKRHDSYKSGYNSTEGGGCENRGYSLSTETRRKLSESRKGKKHSKETRRKMSKAQKGKKFSEETRRKISEANKGKHHSAEAKKKMSGENNGRAKLNLKTVQEIRTKYATENYTHRRLAKKYNVSSATICGVINNLIWNK